MNNKRAQRHCVGGSFALIILTLTESWGPNQGDVKNEGVGETGGYLHVVGVESRVQSKGGKRGNTISNTHTQGDHFTI